MILHGNQRGGARDLALHLLKDENDHVDVHELRGFISQDLESALKESHVISKGTRAKQYLYSLSLNPPKSERVSTKAFESAIDRVEKELGLNGQPRAIVFHEKEGRRHAHTVWSRIDTKEMKAIPLPYTKLKLKEISKQLYLEHGWQMPKGFLDKRERDPNNFTLQQWQQAKRIGKNPKQIKQVLQDSWAVSDDRTSFENALQERGYKLAKGDRRGYVVLDQRCEVFSVSKKWVGVTANAVREKLGSGDTLPSVTQTRSRIAKDMQGQLQSLKAHQTKAIDTRQQEIDDLHTSLVTRQKLERAKQRAVQEQRWKEETRQRQAKFRTGIRGLVDRVTGRYAELKKQNERDTYLAQQRDQRQRDETVFKHIEQRQSLDQRKTRLENFKTEQTTKLQSDTQQFKEVEKQKRDVVDFKQAMQSKGPTLER